MTGPTWYDVLGVSPDASTDEIKTAWRAATDKFEPGSGSRQFQMFNEAADVLLDPKKRTSYDASLGGKEHDASSDDAPEAEATADAQPTDTTQPPDTEAEPPKPEEKVKAEKGTTAQVERGLPRAVVATTGVLFVLTLLSVAILAYLYFAEYRPDQRTADARQEAPAAAERGLTTILAYDYRHMSADKMASDKVITKRYANGYTKNGQHLDGFDKAFDLLAKGKGKEPAPAVATKAVVTADVLNTAIVDASPDKVRVLAFVNQTSRKANQTAAIYQNRVVATMVHQDGKWLIDDLSSY